MNKLNKGFTLIELLAVIVILAIIAAITTPIVLNTINDSRKSSGEISVINYLKAVDLAIVEENIGNEVFEPNECEISLERNKSYIICDGYEEKRLVKINGEKPTSGRLRISGMSVEKVTNLKMGNYYINTNIDGEIVKTEEPATICDPVTNATKTTGNVPSGNFIPGDEYVCQVNESSSYHFFVLSKEGDKVNLILDRNVNSKGGLATNKVPDNSVWLSLDDYILSGGTKESWNASNANNTKGPITAMNFLVNATKEWTNIPNIIMNYTDEGENYGKIVTINNNTVIMDKNGNISSSYESMKSRMPKRSELEAIGCSNQGGSCPKWISNYMMPSSAVSNPINSIYGYWTLSTQKNVNQNAYYVYFNGGFGPRKVENASGDGIRPVITLSKSDIKQG